MFLLKNFLNLFKSNRIIEIKQLSYYHHLVKLLILLFVPSSLPCTCSKCVVVVVEGEGVGVICTISGGADATLFSFSSTAQPLE